MSVYSGNPFVTVADASAVDRASFIRRTYLHLAAAILGFIGLETFFMHTTLPLHMFEFLRTGRFAWLVILGAFMAVSWVADKLARSEASTGLQYLGLGLYTAAQAFLFVPLITLALIQSENGSLLMEAGIITGLLFVGLTATAFMTRKDFSFLGGILTIGGFVAMGVIICSMIFGFELGMLFCGIMCLFAGGSILYTTSNIIHHYRPTQHVAAALALFAGVMLLFWYVLRLLMSRR